MIDRANEVMKQGNKAAAERISGINDNMTVYHYHEFYELYYLEEGERYHLLGGEVYKLTPGQFIIFKPYQMHRSFSKRNTRFSRLLVYFEEELLETEKLRILMEDNYGVFELEPKERIHFYDLLCATLKQDVENEYYEVSMKCLINQLVILLLLSKKEKMKRYKNTRINNVISYMNENYQKKLSTQELADVCYVSKYHLCREFKKVTNLTIIQYINSIRIMHAQKLLLEGESSITHIGSEVGFDSIIHFERIFKQIVGCTPTQYRKNKKN